MDAAISILNLCMLLAAAAIGLCLQRRRTASRRTSAADAGPEPLPRWFWLAALPFPLLAAAGAWLRPARPLAAEFAHLAFGAAECAFFAALAFGVWFGARRSRLRRVTAGGVVGFESLCCLMALATGLQQRPGIPGWVPALLPMTATLLVLLAWAAVLWDAGESREATPPECWHAGLYYNPDDGAVFVEGRAGIGYTLNFARFGSWAVVGGIAGLVAAAMLVLP